MLRPLLIASIATGAVSAEAIAASTGRRNGASHASCPLSSSEFRRHPGDVCVGRVGHNWHFAFAYPAAAARLPKLNALLRQREKDAETLVPEMIAQSRQGTGERLAAEDIYSLDFEGAGLLAFSVSHYQYTGGAHGWSTYETLLWDTRRAREMKLGDLFVDAGAAFAEIRDRLCPVLKEARRREAARGGGDFDGPCPAPPYEASLSGSGGRAGTLQITFNELDGYAGGTYDVSVPMTRRLLRLVKDEFRGAFRQSSAPAQACNSNLSECVRATAPPQPQ